MHASYKPWPSSPGFLSLMWSPCLPAHSCPFPHSSWNHWWCLVTLSIKSKLLTLPCDASVTWPCLTFLTNFVLPSPCPSLSSPCFLSVFEHIKLASTFGLVFLLRGMTAVPYHCLSSSFLSFPFLIKSHFSGASFSDHSIWISSLST